MIRIFALDPRVVAGWGRKEEFRFIHDKFGFGSPRAMLELPRFVEWKRAVFDEAKRLRLTQEDLKRLEEIFRIFSEQRCYRKTSVYNSNMDWLSNAEEEYERKQFAAILTCDNPRSHPAVMINSEIDSGDLRWICKSGMPVCRTADELTEALSSFLLSSADIHLIDPHFGLENRRYRNTITSLVRMLSRTSHAPDTIRVHCMAKATLDFFEGEVRKFANQVPREMKIEFRRWRARPGGEIFHNRYILTELGGVSLGVGLDEGTEGQTDDLLLLPRDLYQLRWSQYVNDNGGFELVDIPEPLMGAGRKMR